MSGGVRHCPVCGGTVSHRYWPIVRHLAGHRPGEVLALVTAAVRRR